MVVTQADVHRAFDFDTSESDIPDIGNSPAQVYSTPARVSFRSQRQLPASPIEEVPMLYKKRKESEISPDDRIMEEVKQNFLGSARVPIGHLKLGIQLREVRETFVQELMSHMTEFHGHFYQPLCVIIDTLDDVTHFRESNASGYHYTVIGGCHNFTAAQRLSEMYPGQEVFKSRYCSIYSNNLSEEARLWLAHRHNKVGEFRHSMTLTDKIQLCRNIYMSQTEIGNDDWQNTLKAILSPGESKSVCKLLIKLAALDAELFRMLQEVLKLYSNGKLKGQKLSMTEIINGPDMKPYVLSTLPALPTSAIMHMLTEVKECRMTIGEMQKEAKLLNKLHTVQRMFMDLLGLRSWNDAREQYPHVTQRQVLEHFCQFNLRSTPAELKVFCSQLMREKDSVSTATFRGRNGVLAYPLLCDAGVLDGEQIARDVPSFSGAALVILDMPQDWNGADVKKFVNTITSININHQMDDFTVAVLSPLKNMAVAELAIKESRHFAEPMSFVYMVPKDDTSDDAKLTECVEGITIARKGRSRRTAWKAGHRRNYLEVKADPYFCIDGNPVDPQQKPVQIYQELVAAFSSPREWVMDACSGTGSASIAALQEGRNTVALEKDERTISSLKLRLSKEVREYLEEAVEEDCTVEDRDVGTEEGDTDTDECDDDTDDA